MLHRASAGSRSSVRAAIGTGPDTGGQAGKVAAMACVVAFAWVATRPYFGIVHDSRLYTLLGLWSADPARFDADPFLHFGSQDRFTVFSFLYAPLLAKLGPAAAAMVLTVLGQACWLAGAFWLATALLRDRVTALVALIGMIVLPGGYGYGLVFSYGEPFVTPRLFAEAASFGALAFLVKGNHAAAACSLAAAGAFHPVMTVPAAGVFLLHAGARDRRWYAAAAAGAILCACLAALGIEPFARLGVRLDPVWFATVVQREGYAFLGSWSTADAFVLASEAALALALLRLVEADGQRLLRAVLVVAAGGLGLTFAGADLLHDQLLVNLQFWRATWLLGAVAHLLALPALMALRRKDIRLHPFAAPLVVSGTAFLAVSRFMPTAYVCAALLLAGGAVYLRRPPFVMRVVPRMRRALLAAAAGIGGATAWFAVRSILGTSVMADDRWAEARSLVLCAAAVGIAAWVLPAGGERSRRRAAMPYAVLAGVFLLGVAATGWDRRTAWERFVESGETAGDGLASFIPGGTNVYWDGGLELLWLHLKRPSYFSCDQGAGSMFFRGTATTFADRMDSFRFEAPRIEWCRQPDGTAQTAVTEAELRRACSREPQLDFIVVPVLVPGLPTREWDSPVEHLDYQLLDGALKPVEVSRYYRYACSGLGARPTSQ